MRATQFALGIVLLIAVTVADRADAQCADPNNSRFPDHVMLCPRGDIPVDGKVTGPAGQVCIGYPVSLNFKGPALTSLTPSPGYSFPVETTSVQAGGMVTFNPAVGGCGAAGYIEYTDPWGFVLGRTGSIVTADLDGNGQVNLSDVVIFAGAYSGPYDPCIDFNGDGVVSLPDIVLFAQHYGH